MFKFIFKSLLNIENAIRLYERVKALNKNFGKINNDVNEILADPSSRLNAAVKSGIGILEHELSIKQFLPRAATASSDSSHDEKLFQPKHSTFSARERHYSTMYEGSEDEDGSSRGTNNSHRPSTSDDVNVMAALLKEVVELKNFSSRSWLGDDKIKSLCTMYKHLEKPHKNNFLIGLACDYTVDREALVDAARSLVDGAGHNPASVARHQDHLRTALSPHYATLFKRIGRLENGVKFLVDLRTDILNCLRETSPEQPVVVPLQQLNITLRDQLSMWFSVGFMRLERVTWRSPCEMLQKISEYEAVHPVRSWADIKRRVGPYRRCFVFVHSSMEMEPLVVLHTALCDVIPATLPAIVTSQQSASGGVTSKCETLEDEANIRAGIFYSITSTQRGLQGIDLGNYLIKRVVRELQAEFPVMSQFATLSPVPNFRPWLMDKIKATERGNMELFAPEELTVLKECISGDFWLELRRTLKTSAWLESQALSAALKLPLLRACAKYLYCEKRRNHALCSVANFHLSNGAVLWRINWRADLSARGMSNSCGIMVNYRYYLDELEKNSEEYLGRHVIAASEDVQILSQAADAVTLMSKL